MTFARLPAPAIKPPLQSPMTKQLGQLSDDVMQSGTVQQYETRLPISQRNFAQVPVYGANGPEPANAPTPAIQRKCAACPNDDEKESIQRKEAPSVAGEQAAASSYSTTNQTGLPGQLKTGVESLSGYSMDDVRVHYNSPKPAAINALAYAQGTEIHLGPQQEKHLPHEAWHVVQQKQGRVKPTTLAMKMPINDQPTLESEADEMGAKAMRRYDTIDSTNGFNTNLKRSLGKIIPNKNDHSLDTTFTIQRIRDKAKMSDAEYKKKLRSTVILYATLDGKEIGIFKTLGGKHAEENLIAHLNNQGFKSGSLEVWLSTSPCSSVFGTRKDNETGCQEKLEQLNRDGFDVKVYADHLYQPQEVGAAERDNDFKTGFSSASAAVTSEFEINVTRLPKSFKDLLPATNQIVAQLKGGSNDPTH